MYAERFYQRVVDISIEPKRCTAFEQNERVSQHVDFVSDVYPKGFLESFGRDV